MYVYCKFCIIRSSTPRLRTCPMNQDISQNIQWSPETGREQRRAADFAKMKKLFSAYVRKKDKPQKDQKDQKDDGSQITTFGADVKKINDEVVLTHQLQAFTPHAIFKCIGICVCLCVCVCVCRNKLSLLK